MIHSFRTTLFMAALLVFALSAASVASNVEYGKPVPAQVTSVQQSADKNSWTIGAKLLKGCRGPDVSWSKAGKYLKFTVVDKNISFAKGQTLQIRWMKYGAMGANGPVSGTSWELAP